MRSTVLGDGDKVLEICVGYDGNVLVIKLLGYDPSPCGVSRAMAELVVRQSRIGTLRHQLTTEANLRIILQMVRDVVLGIKQEGNFDLFFMVEQQETIAELKKQIKELEEYKYMYEDLCK